MIQPVSALQPKVPGIAPRTPESGTIPPGTPALQHKPAPTFGSAASLGLATSAVNSFMGFIEKDRIRGMILEDLFGFGALRTGVDVYRGKEYGTGEFNWLAGRERILREGFSILTDNIASGVAAFALGKFILDRVFKSDTTNFTSFQTHDVFKDALHATGDESREAFLKQLLGNIYDGASGERALGSTLKQHLNWDTIESITTGSARGASKAQKEAAEQAVHNLVSNHLNLDSFDVIYKNGPVREVLNLEHLIKDLHWLKNKAGGAGAEATQGFKTQAVEFIQRNMKAKSWQLSALAVGLLSTAAVPPFINWLTKKINGIDYYPAEMGLRPSTSGGLKKNTASAETNPAVPPFGMGLPTNGGPLGGPASNANHMMGATGNGSGSPFGSSMAGQSAPAPLFQAFQNKLSPQLTPHRFGGASGFDPQRGGSFPLKFGQRLNPGYGAGAYGQMGLAPSGYGAYGQGLSPQDVAAAAPTKKKSWLRQHFPYLERARKDGNPIPLLLTLLPLPAVLGMVDTVNKKLVLPGWKHMDLGKVGKMLPVKEFITKHLRNAYQFGRTFPFTTQQQIATMFAALIMSRLASARTPNEFRERTIDSFAGWGLWIFGTPIMKSLFAKATEKHFDLQKIVDGKKVLRSAEEIGLLNATNTKKALQTAIRDTKKANIWMGFGTLALTVLLLGIVEPIIAMKWTKHNANNE